MASITTLRSEQQTQSARQQLVDSIRDGQPIVGTSTIQWSRSVSTMFLYSDKGLQLYADITKTKAYYPFAAEKEILELYGDEIAQRMFGIRTKTTSSSASSSSPSSSAGDGMSDRGDADGGSTGGSSADDDEDDEPPYTPKHDTTELPPATSALQEKWGDSGPGIYNNGVNGNSNLLANKMGLAVELGSGSLDKTKLLLRSLSTLLKTKTPTLNSIEYKALDLERASLVDSLDTLLKLEPASVKPARDTTPRVQIAGLHADYWEGLAFLKGQDGASLGAIPREIISDYKLDRKSQADGYYTPTRAPPADKQTSILWLGSSVGNFHRNEAVDFLRNVQLAPGDTMLIGVDSCDDKEMVETAYNDPEGVTAAFILEGINQAGLTLHGEIEGERGLKASNFDYVNHYNKELGRHEAYVRCKIDNLEIPIPAKDSEPASKVVLQKGEHLAIEVSYKYTQAEARAMFHAAGFRLVQQWSDQRRLHSIYLLEQPAVMFKSNSPALEAIGMDVPENPYGVPSLAEWKQMWKTWDMLTTEMLPQQLLHQKPIPLRHIPLFYLGHIPAFRDIHLSKYFDENLSSPANFADLFERGIDPDCDQPQKINHWHSEVPNETGKWPALDEILAYERRVRERVKQVYAKVERGQVEMTRRLARVLMMVFEHEAMHYETLIYIALQACESIRPPNGFAIPDFPSLGREWTRQVVAEGTARRELITYSASTVTLGHDDSERADAEEKYDPAHAFGWDVEHPQRQVQVGAFKLSAVPVSNSDYLAFLVDKNETHDSSMFPASWASSAGAEGQSNEKVSAHDVKVRTLYGLVDFAHAAEWPVCASAVQLTAFAEFKGGRLPTRDELAVHFQSNPVDAPTSNVGLANLHPVPAIAPFKQRDGSVGGGSDGGVWLWTSTVHAPRDGFEPSELYPGYSSDFFDGQHLIIAGASFATPNRLARASFQNWYQAKYPYVLAGARIAYD